MSTLGSTAKALNEIRKRIEVSAQKVGRNTSEITLVGASKRQSHELIAEFQAAGLEDIGENYLQEALSKHEALAHLPLTWHFIGQMQSNKSKLIAENFSWVHGIDKLKHAQRLGAHNTQSQRLNVLLQLNVDEEASKGGVKLADAGALSAQIAEIDNIKLRGFMLIPRARDKESAQRQIFARAKELLELTNQQYGLSMDSLSMGMSGDLEAAIMEGSTMVRIGTDLFGART